VQRLLLPAALFQQVEARRLGDLELLRPGGKRQFQQQLVEVVPSQLTDPFVRHHVVFLSLHPDDRCIERPATEVVHHQVFACAPFLCGASLRIFDPRRRRFVDHSHDPEAGAPESFHRKKALVSVGVGWDRNCGIEDLPGI
jgi:hypothetical protein